MSDGVVTDYKMNGRKSLWRVEISIKHLSEHFKGIKASQITTDMINAYIVKRKEIGIENGTINRELAALKRMFTLAYNQTPRKVPEIPYIPKLKEDNIRSGYFEHNQYMELRDALPAEIKSVFIMGYYSGMRKETILKMLFSQIDFENRCIILHSGTTKNDMALRYYLPDELYDALVRQKQIRDLYYPDCPFVFFRDGNQIKDFRGSWETTLRKCGYPPTFKCKDCKHVFELIDGNKKEYAGCPLCNSTRLMKYDKLFHDLRRTAVRNLRRSGTPTTVGMKISGHKTHSIYYRYDIINDDDLITSAEHLSKMHKETEKRLKAKSHEPNAKKPKHLRLVK
ncbi:MAG: site-specific integrase [Nitrospirae bacterium]|nr:site-specific integrase [Nitrospirota bacterium]